MPEPTPQPEYSPERCRLLRSKWMFIESEPDPTVPRSDSGICWCVHTQNCLLPLVVGGRLVVSSFIRLFLPQRRRVAEA
jgi:hypothetical protein